MATLTKPQGIALAAVAAGDPFRDTVTDHRIRALVNRSKVLQRLIGAGYVLSTPGTTDLCLTDAGKDALRAFVGIGGDVAGDHAS